MDNRFVNNGAWGVLFVPYPDSGTPSFGQTCRGTGGVQLPGFGCVYDPANDALLGNTFEHNGYFGNPSNGDFGQIITTAGKPQNCYASEHAPRRERTRRTSRRPNRVCGPVTKAANTGGPLLAQVLCDTGFGKCPPGAHYPQETPVVMRPIPRDLGFDAEPLPGRTGQRLVQGRKVRLRRTAT